MEFATIHLPHIGILKRTNNFLYVDLDDAYIHEILPLIREEGFSTPPYFGSPELAGAHISVAFPKEIENIAEMAECGMKITFMPKKCEIVHLAKSSPFLPDVEEIYLLVIDAPELDRIRKKYGLSKLPHPFHITIGVK